MADLDIVVYRAGSPWATPWEDAFIDGLRAHGVEPEQRRQTDRRVSDLAVIWAHRQTPLFETQRAAGKHYLVMERGYVGDRFAWTSLGFDGLNGRAMFPAPDDGGARWQRLWGDRLQPWKDGGDYALICGQVPGDASVKGVDLDRWYAATAAALAQTHGLPVKFRPHPVAVERNAVAPVPGAERIDGSLDDALAGAAVVATYNSNTGVDAVLAGVPTIAADEGSMAWPVAGHDPAAEAPKPDRADWCAGLAWCQWTAEEIAAGEAWEALRSCL